VRLLASSPAEGSGEECGSDGADDCGVPVNATISLRFDRFLDPSTVNRQAIHVYTGNPDTSVGIPFDVRYDPVERVVQFRMPVGYAFEPRVLYRVELLVPERADDFGIRAFDGAVLGQRGLPLDWSFLTSRVTETQAVAEPPTCDDIVTGVLAFPNLGNCASGECHRAEANQLGAAPEGLWLDNKTNFRNTTIRRVAHETELGDEAGVPLQDPARFGVQMPLIDPQNPGNSYLLYKLLRNPVNFESCAEGTASSVCDEPASKFLSVYPEIPLEEDQSLEPSTEESIRLREWFVRGEPMPYARGGPRGVTIQGLRALSAFIAAGADCSE
jgi:hypothetical protein